MEEVQILTPEISEEDYRFATGMLLAGMNTVEIKNSLLQRGLDNTSADYIIYELSQQVVNAKKARAKKDMLYGALWCIGGTALTMADVGFIFWGAIIFGAIQFIRGVSNING